MTVRIWSKADGFRRCGVAHKAAPTDWPDDAWTKDQMKRLEAEPMLTVERIPDTPTGDDDPAPKSGKKGKK